MSAFITSAGGPGTPAPAATPGAWDWADPAYEAVGDQLTTVDPTLWTDAGGAFGGAKTVSKAASSAASRCMIVNAGRSSGDILHVGNYVDGILISCAAGDFVRAIRVQLGRNVESWTSSGGDLNVMCVFVDGTTSASDYYGAGVFWSAGDEILCTITTTSGSWASAGTYTQRQLLYGAVTSFDFCIERSDTDLAIYVGEARGRMRLMYSVAGVGAGAGFFGLRFARTGGSQYQTALIPAYRESLAAVP